MTYVPKQLIKKHSTDCRMSQGNPYAWHSPEFRPGWGSNPIRRDLTGRNNAKAEHNWVVLHCNDCGCPAELAIYWQYFIDSLGVGSIEYFAKAEPKQ